MRLAFNLLIAICLIGAGVFAGARFFAPSPGLKVRPTKFEEMSPGCLLVAPFPALLAHNFKAETKPRVFLVNKSQQKAVRSWKLDYPVFSAKLDHQGNLWALAKDWEGKILSELVQLDSESRVLRKLSYKEFIEDFDLRADTGTIIFNRLYEKNGLFFDRILEMKPDTQEIVWSFDLDQAGLMEEKLNEHQRNSRKVSHVNSVRYVATNPFNQQPALLLSVRNASRVLLIDYATKKILWSSPAGLMEFQHDARLLDNGQVLLFNNRRLSAFSSVDQIDPRRNELVWQYRSVAENDFHSAILGSAQRLPNGNTLVNEGTSAHLFEINPRKEVVWEYFPPFEPAPVDSAWPLAPLFRVDQYEPSYFRGLGWGNLCD
jgi:hypothetical protein